MRKVLIDAVFHVNLNFGAYLKTPMMQNYFFSRTSVHHGNEVKLLDSGEAIFSEILELLHAAKHRIIFQAYYFEADDLGWRVAQALGRASRRGVHVRLLLDAVGCIFTPYDIFDSLKNDGVDVQFYHAVRWSHLDWRIFKRNHRKIIAVDTQSAIIGGFNISNAYYRSHDVGGIFDLAVRIDGPACSAAWELFDRSWKSPKTSVRSRFLARINLRRRPRFPPAGGRQVVAILANDHFVDRWAIRRELLYSFSQAQVSIDIMNPYFLPDPGVIRALVDARTRGVRVRILLPSHSDVPLIDLGSCVIQHRLVGKGVEVYKWPGFLHAKAVVVDQKLTSIGSFNLDYRSVFHNLEANVHILDSEFAQELTHIFERETGASTPVAFKDWNTMGFSSRLAARMIYRFRAIL